MAYILVAEEDELQADAMRVCLTGEGHQVTVVKGGQAVIDRTRETRPDAIVLDLGMPVSSGLETLERLRTSYGSLIVPVIVVTAARDTGSVLEALHAGADDYLRKPFHPRELAQRVNRMLSGRVAGGRGDRERRTARGSVTQG
jgi:DNA-binding response OmpR family regulator